ncbi:MAG: hypothetical protein R3301_08695 [Saprospiraceae bacterium]|nr:hypothetical protein [Saprospiraceae bacterium]
MKVGQSIFGWASDKDEVWMVDRYEMERFKLTHYYIRDQFSEYGSPFARSRVYFWQDKSVKSCTIKVHVVVTDSNEHAHRVMRAFRSQVPNPNVLTSLAKSVTDTAWFKATNAEEVQFVNVGMEERMVVLIWGNVFFQIESIGEEGHSVRPFLEDLGNNWVGMRSDETDQADFQLEASQTTVHDGDNVTLSRKGPADSEEYSSFLYIAGPKERVSIYRENDAYMLEFRASSGETAQAAKPPFALLIGVRPDGHYVRSNVVRFQYSPE